MDLQRRLKEATRTHHDKIEQTSLLKKLTMQEMDLTDYQHLILKFYGFISPCENMLNRLPMQSLFENRRKTPWLEQDLQTLKITTVPLKCTHLPDLSDFEQALGYLYVMEGSTLGGQIISKMLKANMQITPENGGRYFHGYGGETKINWMDYCSHLRSITDSAIQDKIIYSAVNTFSLLHDWMEK